MAGANTLYRTPAFNPIPEDERDEPTPVSPWGVVGSAGRAAILGPMAPVIDALNDPDQRAAFDHDRHRGNTVGRRIATEDVYDQLDDEVFRITGRRVSDPETGAALLNPVRESLGAGLNVRNGDLDLILDPMAGGWGSPTGRQIESRWRQALAQMAMRDPRLLPLVTRATPLAIEEQAQALRQRYTDEYNAALGDGSVLDRIIRGLQLAPGSILGALSSGAPEQIAQLAAVGGGAGLSWIERLASGAFTGALGQGVVEPAIVEDARRMGEEYTGTQIALDLGVGAILGGVLETPGALHARAADPQVRQRRTERRLERIQSRLEGGAGSGEAVQRVLQGQAESIVVSAHTRDSATDDALPPDWDIDAQVDSINHNDRYVAGLEAAPYQHERTRQAEPGRVELAAREADDAPAPAHGATEQVTINGRTRPRTFERFDASTLDFNPEAFQYKRSNGLNGSTGRLDGVEVWDGQSAGKVIVYENADGSRTVADGHQRTALAQQISERDGQPIMLDGYLYREADGWTRDEVRHLAAQKNLRETPGDPIDTAMLMREAPELIDSSVPQRGAEFRTARGLSRLSDEAFGAVRAGVIEPRLGAIIGEVAGARPEIHESLVRLFKNDPPATLRDASFIASEAMHAETFHETAAQMSMFSDAPELSGMRERAEILRFAANMLREDRKIFSVAERNADALEAAGNVMASEANARRADAAGALVREIDVMATRPGPVADALREIAALASREKLTPRDAAALFVRRVTDLLDERGLLGLRRDVSAAAPRVDPPPAQIEEAGTRLDRDSRAAELREAHDADAETRENIAAEIALERAIAGDMADMPALDAIGFAPAELRARVEDAADALGVDDPTVIDVAAAILARDEAALLEDARTRAAPASKEALAYEREKTKAFSGRTPDVPANHVPPEAVHTMGIAHPKADGATVRAVVAEADEVVKTSWGAELNARKGKDHILTDDNGHRWVVRSDLFRATYIAAGEGRFQKNPELTVGFWISPDKRVIHTLEGDVEAKRGDYVMVGAIGEMWPLKPDRFAQRNEVITPDAGLADDVADAEPTGPMDFADAVEQGARVEAPFNPFDIDDETKLHAAIDAASVPELRQIQRSFGIGNFTETSREQFRRSFVEEWRDATGLGPDPDSVYVRLAVRPDKPPKPEATVAQWNAAAKAAFPRLANKLLERGRLIIVQSVKDLPNGGEGFYARLFDNWRTAKQRRVVGDQLVALDTSDGAGHGEARYYAWQGTATVGPMAAELWQGRPDGLVLVNFGKLTPRGPEISVDVGASRRNALETLVTAMAAVDRHAREKKPPAYNFVGRTEAHNEVYDMLGRAVEPPPGYVFAKDPRHGFLLIRNDIMEKADGKPGIALAIAFQGRDDAARYDVRDRMAARKFKDRIRLMERAKRIQFPTPDGTFARADGSIIGYSEGGRGYIVADNAPVDMARGLILHEMAAHVGMREMLGEEGFAHVLGEADRLRLAGDADLKRGYEMASNAGTPAHQMAEETLAYAIQHADERTMSTGFRGLFMRILNSARAWLWRTFPKLRTEGALTFEDMRFLAMGALRHVANDDGPIKGMAGGFRAITHRRIAYAKAGEVITNPTKADMLRLTKPQRGEPAYKWDNLRFIHDADGNLHVARGYDFTHDDIAREVGGIPGYQPHATPGDSHGVRAGTIFRRGDELEAPPGPRMFARDVPVPELKAAVRGADPVAAFNAGQRLREIAAGDDPGKQAQVEADRIAGVVEELRNCA